MGSAAALSSRFLKCLQGWRFPQPLWWSVPGLHTFPMGKFFPQHPARTFQATICVLCFLLHHLCHHATEKNLNLSRVWLCHLFNCPSSGWSLLLHCSSASWSCQGFVAGTRDGTFFTKEVTNILLDVCGHLAPFRWSHTVFANRPRSIRVCVWTEPSDRVPWAMVPSARSSARNF